MCFGSDGIVWVLTDPRLRLALQSINRHFGCEGFLQRSARLSKHEWMLRAGYMLTLRIELACILPGMQRLSHAIRTATSRSSHAWRGDHVEFGWARGCRWAWRRAGGSASSIGQGVDSCRPGMCERRTSAAARLPRMRPPKPSSARANHRRFS